MEERKTAIIQLLLDKITVTQKRNKLLLQLLSSSQQETVLQTLSAHSKCISNSFVFNLNSFKLKI